MHASDPDRDRRMRELEELHRLDREALEACREAEKRLEGSEWQRAVKELAEEHERRAEEIAALMRRLGAEPSASVGGTPTARAIRRSVVAGAMGGDRGVLLTLLAAEQSAARRRETLPGDLRDLLERRDAVEHAHVTLLAEGVARLTSPAS